VRRSCGLTDWPMDAESSSSRIFKVHERGYGGLRGASLWPHSSHAGEPARLHSCTPGVALRTEAVRVRLTVVAALKRGTGELDSKAGRAWE
jgi:hypothetical protein